MSAALSTRVVRGDFLNEGAILAVDVHWSCYMKQKRGKLLEIQRSSCGPGRAPGDSRSAITGRESNEAVDISGVAQFLEALAQVMAQPPTRVPSRMRRIRHESRRWLSSRARDVGEIVQHRRLWPLSR